jgi:signal transduction histidine kinase
MSEPLSYKNLEDQLKALTASKQQMLDNFNQKERQLLQKLDLLQQISNQAPQGILLVQADAVKYANLPALQMFDTSFDALKQVAFSELVQPNWQTDIISGMSKIITSDSDNYTNTIEMVTLSQKVFKVVLRAEKLKGTVQPAFILVMLEAVNNSKHEVDGCVNEKILHLFNEHLSEGFILLDRLNVSDRLIDTWQVSEISKSALKHIDYTDANPTGKLLINILETGIKVPEILDTTFDESFELHLPGQRRFLMVQAIGLSQNQILLKLTESTELAETKSQLAKNLQQSELFTEILNLFNSDATYDIKYKQVLEKIGFHLKARRIAFLHDIDDLKISQLYEQYAGKDTQLLPDDFSFSHLNVPSYRRLLEEKKMILGFSLQYLSSDLKALLEGVGMHCAYIFPIIVEQTIYGSLVFESYQQNPWDNSEIGFMRMITVLVANLTTRQANELKLLNAKNKAEEADRLKSSFLANMSHDIRIPMTAIIGFSDLLADSDLTIGEREEFIELISKSGHDLLTLIDNIVDLSKIETGQLKLQIDKCSLGAMFKDILSNHIRNSKIINTDNLDITLEIKELYKAMPFETDVFRLKQVFNNLIDNAIKFTDRGAIRFGISNIWEQTVEFFVQDTGIGIAEETQSVIFERFSKIDHTYTKEYTGTGLGLAISKSLVELMGGEIRVVSYVGKGSTFYFTHPLTDAALQYLSKQLAEADNKVSPYLWDNKTIVIVEDVEQNYKYLEYMLFPTNAKVIWLKNGKEAVDYFVDKNPADAVLMDIRLPVMNGIEATKAIVKLSAVPIIAQTAYTLGDEKQLAMSAGCIGYISKPVNGAKLLSMLDGLFKQFAL